MSSNVSYCRNCKYKFDFAKFAYCPSCGYEAVPSKNQDTSQPSFLASAASRNVHASYSANNTGSDSSTSSLLKAQNKTTYAVRSLALYLFITVTTSFFGLFVIYVFPQAAVLGALIIMVGFIVSLSVGISELNKSKP